MVYLDNSATTRPSQAVRDAMVHSMEEVYFNPSALYGPAMHAEKEFTAARKAPAHQLGVPAKNVIFTSGATESCNWMVKCLRLETDAINYNGTVHHAVSEASRSYLVPIATHGKPSAILSLVNNETGQISDVYAFRLYHRYRRIGIDATAAVGHIIVNFRALGADYMAFGGHKFGAPKGIGALIVKEGCPINPLLHGGAQERGERGGTVSVPLVCAMAAALEWHTAHLAENFTHLIDLRDHLLHRLTESGVEYQINGGKNTAAHILSLTFPGVYGASLAAALSYNGVMVSTGSACSSGENRASENLIASGLTKEEALSTVRFSFDWQNTPAEADEAAKIIAQLIPTLRRG